MSNDSVAHSRAGDVFHYRWAARRCLKLIHPESLLKEVYIEGSPEIEKAGECVIDVSEYSVDTNGKKKIDYFQLKHTSAPGVSPFTLSNLKKTIEGFSKRYIQHRDCYDFDSSVITFYIITNRKIAKTFKDKISAILKNNKIDKKFLSDLEVITGLSSSEVANFLKLLHLQDDEGNYNFQKDELRIEMSQLIAGSIDSSEVNNLVFLVQEKVMPDSNHIITREDVLSRFGIHSYNALYPAPPKWNEDELIIDHHQKLGLKKEIENATNPIIIKAAGGVGKSVFCRQFVKSLPNKDIGVSYDCFGNGSYRNRSEFRHGHRHALVQIANELATKGLCNPIIVKDTSLAEDIMKQFLFRIESSLNSLKEIDHSAKLYILVDAADNAELAAKEYGDSCFASELLKENVPKDCKIVFLCRPERVHLLRPRSNVIQIELEAFSKEESLLHLRSKFPEVTESQGVEFHRLTSKNPRVQANVLDIKFDTIEDLLNSLSPSGTSVQDQIASILKSAIDNIKNRLPPEHHTQINSICLGLASLPPHIPIDILSRVSGVSVDDIKSFIYDIGRTIWMSDDSIQFRDEPTETWFRETFMASKDDYQSYLERLEPISKERSYVAEILPQLYLEAGQYEKLIKIALSDSFLPENNPIDARKIRVYRLQFAFKAALKIGDKKDAIKLAMRAGEEVAGNERQLELFKNNTDLIPVLQSKEKVQEIAFKRLLSSGWGGSENVYSASLLSGIRGYHGEASGYLRAALNWLTIYYEDQKNNHDRFVRNEVSNNDVLDLAYAHLNILGVKDSINFLKRFSSKSWVFSIVQDLAKRLIDVGKFQEIDEFLNECKDEVYFTVAVIGELQTLGRFSNKKILEPCLKLLSSSKTRILLPRDSFDDPIVLGIITFLEACLYHNVDKRRILKVIKYYNPDRASRMVWDTHFSEYRIKFFRALALKKILEEKSEVQIQEILPAELNVEKRSYEQNNEVAKLQEVIDIFFPWYMMRLKIIFNQSAQLFDEAKTTKAKTQNKKSYSYRQYSIFPQELTKIFSSILILYSKGSEEEINRFYEDFINKNQSFNIQTRLELLRAANRLDHLTSIRQKLEIETFQLIQSFQSLGPDDLADKYIYLARAVLINSIEDSSIYFNEAIKIASKFGYEIVDRWKAVVSLAERYCDNSEISDEIAYRFIRCAELVGENVDREKYWNRGKAIQVCTKMSAGIGLSALSRWRDRDVGRFHDEFEDVLTELVRSKKIPPKLGWSLSIFISFYNRIKFLGLCIESESNHDVQNNIFQDAINQFEREGISNEDWKEIIKISACHNITNKTLKKLNEFISVVDHSDEKITSKIESTESKLNQEWDSLFEDLDILSPEGFNNLLVRLKTKEKEDEFKWRIRDLLDETMFRIDINDTWCFIEMLFLSNEVSRYDIQNVLSRLSQDLKQKVSFKSNFEKIIYGFGQRFAHELVGESLVYFLDSMNLDSFSIKKLKDGIISGLSFGIEFAQSDVFFGFVQLASSQLENEESENLLDYALSRFELHIEKEFGDGEWGEKLKTSKDINENIAGIIWSALGSPRSEVRWNAAHCVRRLSKFNCVETIDALINWLQLDRVNAFGSFKFPFYNLHARQYLLMALESISYKNPEILKTHHDLFVNCALDFEHILIQQFAANIIINIENNFAGTINNACLGRVMEIGKSPFEIQEKDYNFSINSYWHKAKEIDIDLDFSFGFDMRDYWYKPLGVVFSVPENQVVELAANVIFNDWGLNHKGGFKNDPRADLWNSSNGERETYYYKSSYPTTDNFDFYLGYHALMVVAAKMLEKMPLIKKSDWNNEPFVDWISRHSLIFKNGSWLSDYRDALPINRPLWLDSIEDDSWQKNIKPEDFIFYLLGQQKNNTWITVRGGLHEKEGDRKEVFSVSTALVSKSTSEALLNALTTCPDPMDFKLPDFDEERFEIDSGIFQLKGWLSEHSLDKGIEELDPQAFGIHPPSFLVDENILNTLNLKQDDNFKNWIDAHSSELVLQSRIWSSFWKGNKEEVDQSGTILKADIKFLKKLCKIQNCELIFDVSLKRDFHYRYSREKKEYTKPLHKIFILSEDGKLRTTETSYQIG